MGKRIAIIVSFLLAAGPPPHAALAAGGGDPFAFLLLPTDARSVGMGGACVAAVDDSNAIFHNPGALADRPRHSASFMHNHHFEGVTQEVFTLGFKQGWGFGINYLNYGDIPRTTASDPGGSGLADYGASELALSAGYGRRMNAFITLGGAFKVIRSEIADYSAGGAAVDVGGLVEVEGLKEELPLTLGWSVRNLGLSKPKYASTREGFPILWRAGAAYRLGLSGQRLLAVLDIEKAGSDDMTFHPGVEWAPSEALAVRLGYDGRNQAGPGITAGLAWNIEDFSLSYGLAPFGELGESHRFSVSMRFGKAAGAPSAAKRTLPRGERRKRRGGLSPYRSIFPTHNDADAG